MFTPRILHTPALRRPMQERRIVSYVPASQIQEEMDKMFDGMMAQMLAPLAGLQAMRRRSAEAGNGSLFLPCLDVSSTDKEYTITTELPGVSADSVQVEVKENTLTIKGEKKQEATPAEENAPEEGSRDVHVTERVYGSFERMLSLPEDAVLDEIKAAYKDGVLTITVPRKEPEQPQARAIEISKE